MLITRERNFTQSTLRRAVYENIDADWAKKSKFYKTIMSDGHIYNPYIHRRWLPMMYIDIIQGVSNGYYPDIQSSIKAKYSGEYSIKFLISEIKKLAMLENKDQVAFRERSIFFSVDNCKTILISYFDSIIEDKSYRRTRYLSTIKRNRYMDIKVAFEIISCIRENIKNANSYKEMADILSEHKIYKYAIISDEFVECFLRSGAYYTLKHLILFEHKTIKGKTTEESCNYLKECINFGADKLNEIVKDILCIV